LERDGEEVYTFDVSKLRENHTLVYPVSKLELSLKRDEIYKGNLTFEVRPECEISGFLYTSHYRMKCGFEEFYGKKVRFSYTFDASGMEENDCVNGEFCLVTSIGEYTLPFEVKIRRQEIHSSIGPIRNLFHFVNLARSNWAEAVDVFYSPEFDQIFSGSDRQYKSAYRGLCGTKYAEAEVEEFLLLTRKKQAVHFEFETSQITITSNMDKKYAAQIRRDSWGYTRLEITTDAPFLALHRKELTAEDFIANRAQIGYHIETGALHEGKNFGRIYAKSALQTVVCEIVVHKKPLLTRHGSYTKQLKQLFMQFLTGYIYYCLKENEEEWNENAKNLTEQILTLDSNNLMARLYQADILFRQKRENEAKWILQSVDYKLAAWENKGSSYPFEATARVYRIYLEAYYTGDEYTKQEAAAELWDRFHEMPDDLLCLSMLLKLDEELKKDALLSLQHILELYHRGNRSPMLYMQAFRIYRKMPVYLDALEDLGLQSMIYAARYRLLTQEVIDRINHLAGKSRRYSDSIYRLLTECFECDRTNETLRTICTILIKNNKCGRAYFKWFEKAVGEQLRITRLYEYYMMSKDLTDRKLLPNMVLMYFSYRCDLDYKYAAYIYANILEHKEEEPEMYERYEEQIERFVFGQVNLGHINEDLAFLYQKIIKEQMIDERFGTAFTRLLFMYKITVADPDVRYVVLVEDKRSDEQKFPLDDGVAYIPIYDDEYSIVLQKNDGTRYSSSIPFTVKELLVKPRFWSMIEEYAEENSGAGLYFCRNYTDLKQMSQSERAYLVRLYRNIDYTAAYRRQIGMDLMQYYYDTDQMNSLDQFLTEVDLRDLHRQERANIIRLLVLRDMYERAYENLMIYGFEEINIKQLTQLFYYGLDKYKGKKNIQLTAIAAYIFDHGRNEEQVLSYLISYYDGSVRKMCEIWKRSVEKGLPAREIAARIIVQTLFTGSYVARRQEIFRYYFESQPNPRLVTQYLSDCAYRYFVKQQVMDENVFAIMLEQQELPQICKIAVVYFFACDPAGMSYREKELVAQFIGQLLSEHIFFPFFNRFVQSVPILLPLSEKTFVEYRTMPGTKVILHYVAGENGEYRKEPMTEIYDGYYCKSFDLFFGETLQYYITEENGEAQVLTRSAAVEKSDSFNLSAESRYTLLNQIIMSDNLDEKESLKEMVYDYAKQSFIADKLFGIE
jgi:hypothetical protein